MAKSPQKIKPLYFVEMPDFSQSQTNLSQTVVHYLKLEEKRVKAALKDQEIAEQKQREKQDPEDPWTQKARLEILSMDEDRMYRWHQEALNGSPYLLGGGMPIEFIKRRMQKEERICSGRDLFVLKSELAECVWCLFGNPMDRVMATKRCMICLRSFEGLLILRKAYKLNVAIDYNKWMCRFGHVNDLSVWYCNNKECWKSMRSKGSKGCLVNDDSH